MFLGQHLDSACVIGVLTPLVLPMVRLCETADDLNVSSEREMLQPQSYLCLCLSTEWLEMLKYVGKFSCLHWKIITIGRNGSTLPGLLPLTLMGVLSLRNSSFHYGLAAATKSTRYQALSSPGDRSVKLLSSLGQGNK